MDTTQDVKNTNTPAAGAAPEAASQGHAPHAHPQGGFRRGGFRGGDKRPGGPRKGPERAPRAKPEFDQKIISIRRVTRVASGGRRFSFSVALVAGDRKGKVGVGTGKANDTSIAIDKALRNAKKHMLRLTLTKDMSIPYEVSAKYTSARVTLKPTRGKGLVAGSSVRSVLELAGIKNVTGKILSGSKNRLNNAQVAIKALRAFAQK